MTLRYRVFDKTAKEMHSPEDAQHMFYVDPCGNVMGQPGDWDDIARPDCVAMLSTGLRDKNGVEIFESDVLVTHLNVEAAFDTDLSGIVAWPDGESGFVITDKDWGKSQRHLSEKHHFSTVVGNIHEKEQS